MNINELSFDVFYIPHSKKWSTKVVHKGVRIAAPFLIECADTPYEMFNKLAIWIEQMNGQPTLSEQIKGYVEKNPSGE